MSKKRLNQFTVRFKNNVDPRIIEFANFQDNFSDTILYLIEKEIGENGIRNLQTIIPPIRSIEGFSITGQAATYSYIPPTSKLVAQPTSNPVTPTKALDEEQLTKDIKPIEVPQPTVFKEVTTRPSSTKEEDYYEIPSEYAD